MVYTVRVILGSATLRSQRCSSIHLKVGIFLQLLPLAALKQSGQFWHIGRDADTVRQDALILGCGF